MAQIGAGEDRQGERRGGELPLAQIEPGEHRAPPLHTVTVQPLAVETQLLLDLALGRRREFGTPRAAGLQQGESRAIDDGVGQISIPKIGTAQIGAGQDGTLEHRAAKPRIREIGAFEHRADEAGIAQVGALEICAAQAGIGEISVSDGVPAELGMREIRPARFGIGEIRAQDVPALAKLARRAQAHQLGVAQIGHGQHRVVQRRAAEAGAA
jgi:hypothetical protein